ncbi:MAG: UbiX family flavin prenyltransferase [Candidatus Tectomicrobia bacterium]|nr:UbiX family flavin prenyltransferase [Candidatus Tectomicrobia bacterium]
MSTGGEKGKRRIIVGITGASGSIYGVRILEELHKIPEIECHLVMSGPARRTIEHETDWKVGELAKLADVVHDEYDIGASISSGSFRTEGMIIAPCSIKTLAGIANSYNDNLMTRAADVVLKERRRLVLMIREAPFHIGHLRMMTHVTEMGAIIWPPIPSFYSRPRSLQQVVDHSCGRALDMFGIEHQLVKRWKGMEGDSVITQDEGPVGDIR